MALLMILCLVIVKPARSEAAVPALFAAVPVTWPVIGGILIAAGVGTAAWWASQPEQKRAEIVESVKDSLLSKGLTLRQQAELTGALVINQAGEYIRGAIVDGVSMISNSVIDCVLDVAQSMDLTGGLHGTVESFSPFQVKVGDVIGDIKYLAPALLTSAYVRNWGSEVQYNTLKDVLSYIPQDSFLFVNSSDTNYSLFYTPVGDIQDQVIRNVRGIQDGMLIFRLDKSVTSYRINIGLDGTISTSSGNQYEIYGGYGKPIDSGILHVGNIGDYVIDQWGAAIGELGQAVIDALGGWELPAGSESIDGYGEASRVALDRDAIGIDGIAGSWPATIAYPDSLALPDVAEGDGKAIPITTTQEIAIGGVVPTPRPIPGDPQLTGSFNQFLVPEWIKTRFPWCIPFDIADAISELTGPPEAPVLHYEVDLFGYDFDLDIDLSMFDDIMVMIRYGELLGFSFILMHITRELIRW